MDDMKLICFAMIDMMNGEAGSQRRYMMTVYGDLNKYRPRDIARESTRGQGDVHVNPDQWYKVRSQYRMGNPVRCSSERGFD